jgi:hypothetical protein
MSYGEYNEPQDKTITIRLSTRLHARIETLSRKTNRSISHHIKLLLFENLRRLEEDNEVIAAPASTVNAAESPRRNYHRNERR